MVFLKKNYRIKIIGMLNNNPSEEKYITLISKLINTIIAMVVLFLFLIPLIIYSGDIQQYINDAPKRKVEALAKQTMADSLKIEFKKQEEYNSFWSAKSINDINDSVQIQQLNYGQDLIAHTAKYFGPKGTVMQITNGMNCQNCHLEAGTKAWGNNYGSVFSTYPKYRARSGAQENIYKRINDCFERSLNGKALDTSKKEMQAIKAYIEYIGSSVKKGEKAKASGIYDLAYLNREANATNGKALYATKCASCHQPEGQGQLALDKIEYTYPPLWGNNSYNSGAGLFRISRLAGYIKYNMPQGATFKTPQLTDEEAWDIAAFVNAQPRPSKDLSKDWPKISEKPVDHPFGPFADSFSTIQHKFGPYQPIADLKKKNSKK